MQEVDSGILIKGDKARVNAVFDHTFATPGALLTRFATKIMGSAFVKKVSVAKGATNAYLGGTDSPTAYSASAWSQVRPIL